MLRWVRTVTEKDVKEDVRLFFQNPDHWAYRYGSPTPGCNPNSPYHRKQIEVIFEDRYFHWVTNRAVDELIDEGFLKQQKRASAYFVYRADVGATENDIDMRIKVIEKYSDPAIVKGIGAYAELLYQFLFRVGGFKIVGENTNEYAGRKWMNTNHNLDYIVKKGTVAYGVEIKNTLNYMENDEFEIKLEMCEFLGLAPLDREKRTQNPVREDELNGWLHFRFQNTDLSADSGTARQRDLGDLAPSGYGMEKNP